MTDTAAAREPETDSDATGTAAPGFVFVIVHLQRSKDRDNYTQEEEYLCEDEGFFTSRESAQARVDALDAPAIAAFEASVDASEKEYRKRLRARATRAREIQALKDAGIKRPSISPLPEPHDYSKNSRGERRKYHEQDSFIYHEVRVLEPAS